MKTVLALIACRCQIAVVRFGVCRFRANGVENDGVTPKRGKSGRSETSGKPREGTQPRCRKPEERPPRHGGCGARGGHSGRGGLRAHRRPGAGARLLPRHPLPVAVSSPATGDAAGGPPHPPAAFFCAEGGRLLRSSSPRLRGEAGRYQRAQCRTHGAFRYAPLPLGGRGWGRASRRDGRLCRASPAASAGAEAAPHPASPASGRGGCRRQSA